MISEAIEPDLYGYIIGKATSLGCITHAVGGIEDHIHLLVSIPPHLSLAEFVQQIKGGSARFLNGGALKEGARFEWQRGYGVFSLSSRQLNPAIAYIANQREHHQQATLIPALERGSLQDDGPLSWDKHHLIAESQATYLLEALE